MATEVQLQNPSTGVLKTGLYGFSWTSFFFGGFPALFRGDVGIGLGLVVVGFLAGVVGLGLGWFVVSIIWAFMYNKMYTTKLLDAGYKLADTPEEKRSSSVRTRSRRAVVAGAYELTVSAVMAAVGLHAEVKFWRSRVHAGLSQGLSLVGPKRVFRGVRAKHL